MVYHMISDDYLLTQVALFALFAQLKVTGSHRQTASVPVPAGHWQCPEGVCTLQLLCSCHMCDVTHVSSLVALPLFKLTPSDALSDTVSQLYRRPSARVYQTAPPQRAEGAPGHPSFEQQYGSIQPQDSAVSTLASHYCLISVNALSTWR
jgi:hypothetical protein